MEIGAPGPRLALSLDVFCTLAARSAIDRAREIGCAAVGIPAARKDFSPASLGAGGARDLAVYLAKNGLSASWVSAGEKGRFTVSAALDEDVARAGAVIELAGRLRADAASAKVGPLGAKDSPSASRLREALTALAAAADLAGVRLALEAAPGDEGILDAVTSDFPGAPLGRLLNPASALFSGRDPVDDASSAPAVAAVLASDASAEETALAPGEGRVPWRDFLAALGAREYYGYVTIGFAARGDATARAAKALEFLRRIWIS